MKMAWHLKEFFQISTLKDVFFFFNADCFEELTKSPSSKSTGGEKQKKSVSHEACACNLALTTSQAKDLRQYLAVWSTGHPAFMNSSAARELWSTGHADMFRKNMAKGHFCAKAT